MECIGVGRTAEVFAMEGGKALKLFRPGFERSMQPEYDVAARLAAMDVMAPSVYGTAEVDGRVGILYERVMGDSMLQWIWQAPGRMPEFAAQLAQIHLRIHGHHVREGFPSIKAWLGWHIRRDMGISDEVYGAAHARLEALPEENCLLHMDLHPDNILGSPARPVVIDWGNACYGAPGADVCRTLLMLSASQTASVTPEEQAQLSTLREMGAHAYMGAYLAQSGLAEEDLMAWMLPVAVARLADRIDGEDAYLHSLIAREMARI